jgi:predicted transcriptional regulator
MASPATSEFLVTLTADDRRRLDELAEKTDRSRCAVIRQLLRRAIVVGPDLQAPLAERAARAPALVGAA